MASDVEVGTNFFFVPKKNWRELTCGPPTVAVAVVNAVVVPATDISHRPLTALPSRRLAQADCCVALVAQHRRPTTPAIPPSLSPSLYLHLRGHQPTVPAGLGCRQQPQTRHYFAPPDGKLAAPPALAGPS